ncbi:MAG: hypothetical protein QOJ19_1247 [Acidimicrobiia bacterium]|jgi:hypothetical protein|nr:hypothetical protein [Acidimicrobiia bacterium]
MDTNELHEELLRMGRRPVPAPRQEFVEDLLARIKVAEDLPMPAPIQLVPRQPWARFRMVAAGAVAAALLAAVGLFSLAKEHSGNSTQLNLQPLSGQQVSDTTKSLEVSSDGKVTGSETAGEVDATCKADARIKLQDRVFECKAGQKVRLTIADGRVIDAVNLDTGQGPQALPAAKDTAAPTTQPPTTTTTSQPNTTVPADTPAGQATASAVIVPSSTTTTTEPTPTQLAGGSPAATTTFELNKTISDALVTISWPRYADQGFSKYVVLQTISNTTQLPDTPTWPTNQVAAFPKADTTNYAVTLDGKSSIPVNTRMVSYRVAVVDAKDQLLALSSPLTLELQWTLKPSGDLSPSTTTTTSTSTTTTAAPTSPTTTPTTAPTTTTTKSG